MTQPTQLLCVFTSVESVDVIMHQIIDNYDIAFDTIYVLENVDMPSSLCCTFNINTASVIGDNIPKTTISLHRKKATNTLYTINALNLLVEELNGGRKDNKFIVPWTAYQNAILVTAYDKLKRINTRLVKIVKVSEFKKI